MPFSIQRIDPALLNSIYTHAMARELDEYIYASRSWIGELSHQKWAIDGQRRACLFWVHMPDRLSSQQSYVFAWNHGVVLLRQFEPSRYSILYASPRLNHCMETVRDMMREAIVVGGDRLSSVHGKSVSESSLASIYAELAGQ